MDVTQQEPTQDPFVGTHPLGRRPEPGEPVWRVSFEPVPKPSEEARLYITSSGGWIGPSETYAALMGKPTRHE